MRLLPILVVAVLLAPAAFAQTGQIKLLALTETSGGAAEGSVARLTLEIRQGDERVFLETLPLTKIATQISVRFAQQIACKELRQDCGDKDFIYTIVSQPGLVGGPSAGAAAAVLTAAMLEGRTLRDDVAITGTINGGGIIGPVGGVKEKIEAASRNGVRTVLVPAGTKVFGESNVTLNLTAWGERNNVTVIEVATLDDALFQFTGVRPAREETNLSIDDTYLRRMNAVAQLICRRTSNLSTDDGTDEEGIIEHARNLTVRSDALYRDGRYYAAASYCFRANIEWNTFLTRQRNESRQQLGGRIKRTFRMLAQLSDTVDQRELRTMTDLQTYISVQERILEAADALVEATKSLEEEPDASRDLIVYAEERLVSARSWMAFFGLPGQALVLSKDALERSCLAKLSEAEERFSYVRSFAPDGLDETRTTLDRAHLDARNGSFALCLGKASKAKAEADLIVTGSAYEEDQLKQLLGLKLGVVRREMAAAQRNGYFPLIGYNYYEYALSLAQDDPYSALLFAEYALELTNVDVYFSQERSPIEALLRREVQLRTAELFAAMLAAALVGAAGAMLVLRKRSAATRRHSKPSPAPLARRRRGKKR